MTHNTLIKVVFTSIFVAQFIKAGLLNWSVLGINYLKANLSQRQEYALNEKEIVRAYEIFRGAKINNALIISTCNRTEYFIPAEHKKKAINLISDKIYHSRITKELFHCKEYESAVKYFFRICCGLESQIVGDFEILGQVRRACSIAKKNQMLSGTWERVINNALGAAKKARTQTGFYSGASSTSYASIEYLKKSALDLKNSNFLVIGAGKIGSHTIDHLLKVTEADQITISNRSVEKADHFAEKKGLRKLPFSAIKTQVQNFDVVICATNAPTYILDVDDFEKTKQQIIVDLSVPLNVNPKIGEKQHVQLINVDELSSMINRNLEKREAERTKVELIIEDSFIDLSAWFTIKSGMPMLAELKEELTDLKREALSKVSSDRKTESEQFLNEYTDELFNQLSQKWIKKVRNKTIDAN